MVTAIGLLRDAGGPLTSALKVEEIHGHFCGL